MQTSPANDCCCFLDPDTVAYNAGTNYMTGDLCTDSGKTYRSIVDDNQGNAVGDTDYWEVCANTVSCANSTWDDYYPYGGCGRSPAIYTITGKIVWKNSAHVTTVHADDLTGSTCGEFSVSTTDSDGFNVTVGVNLYVNHGGSYYVDIRWDNDDNDCTTDLTLGGYSVGDTAYQIHWAAGSGSGSGYESGCTTGGQITLDSTPLTGNSTFCGGRRDSDGPPATIEYGDATIAWRPGAIPEWDSGTTYDVDDLVAWKASFYQAIESSLNIEPGVDADWELYWDEV